MILLCFFLAPVTAQTTAPGGPEFTAVGFREVFRVADGFRLPSDVGLAADGRLFILDGTADCIRVYDRHGKFLYDLGSSDLLNQPLGLDVSSDGTVVVADSGNHRLVLFAADKQPPRFFPLPPTKTGEESDPTDVILTRDGGFAVVDNDHHRIIQLDQTGSLIWSTGTMGRNPGEFRYPFMLAGDQDGNIYAVEVINTGVQVLRPDGSFNHFIGGWGIEPGQFFRPKGIAVNGTADQVFVSDSYLGVIQTFNRGGEFLGLITDPQGKIIKFTTPVGLAVLGNRLYVVEMYSGQVIVLEKTR